MAAGPETEPVSLMVCVQRGGGAAGELNRLSALGPLLKLFTASGPERAQGKAALVVFDSKPTWVEPFSTDTDTIAHDLRTLPAGDGGAAIRDAVGYAVNLLEEQPGKRRRILLLVSGARDQGSRNFGEPELVERLGTSDVVVVSLMLTPSKAAARTWTKGDVYPEPGPNELAPLLTTVEAMRRNLPKTLAGLSGGEYVPLTATKDWESALAVAARDARRRYVLSLHPMRPTPGLHLIRVKLKGSDRARVTARSIYWAIERGNANADN
jgi:hypothetical protein